LSTKRKPSANERDEAATWTRSRKVRTGQSRLGWAWQH